MAFSTPIAHTAKHSTDKNTVTTTGIDTTGADFLVLVHSHLDGTSPTISDSKSNTWHALTTYARSGGVTSTIYWCVPTSVGTGHTFTSSNVSNSYPAIAVAAFSGAAASPFDTGKDDGTNGTSATSAQVPTGFTPSEANCLVIAAISNIKVCSIDGGFTVTDSDAGGANGYGASLAYLIQTSAAAARPSWSWTGADDYGTGLAAFKSAGGGTQTFTPSAVSVSWSVPAPAFAHNVTLAPAAVSSAWSLPSQALAPGALTFAPAAVAASWAVPVVELNGAQVFTPAAVTATWAIPTPTVAPGLSTLVASAVTGAWSVPAPTLTHDVTLTPAAASVTWVVPTPSFASGTTEFTPDALTASWLIPAPVFSAIVTYTPAALTAAWVLPAETLVPGLAALAAGVGMAVWHIPTAQVAGLAAVPDIIVRVGPSDVVVRIPPDVGVLL